MSRWKAYVHMLFVRDMDVLSVLAGGCIIVVVFFYCIGCSGSVFVLGFAGDQFCSSEGEDVCCLRPQDESRDAFCCSWSCKFSFYHKQLRSAYEMFIKYLYLYNQLKKITSIHCPSL